jgi:excisionase family DNA binding protein
VKRPLMNYKQAAEYLSMSEGTLHQWVMVKRIPHIKLGKPVRFDPDEIDRWIDERAVVTNL